MPLKFYLDMCSQPCRAIVIFCRINAIDFQHQIVSFVTGETRSEAFSKITPMKKVPVLQDGDFKLTESAAILYHLTRTQKVAAHWYPADSRQKALVDEYVFWHYCPAGLRLNAALVFIEQALKPHRTGHPPDIEERDNKIDILEPVVDQLENFFLTLGPYIIGNDLTLADLLAICELMQPMSVGYDPMPNRPKLQAWYDRVKARLQPHFDEVNKEILQFSSNYRM